MCLNQKSKGRAVIGKPKLIASTILEQLLAYTQLIKQSVVVQKFSRGGPTKCKSTFFQIAKLRFSTIFADFHQNSQFLKTFSGDEFKS